MALCVLSDASHHQLQRLKMFDFYNHMPFFNWSEIVKKKIIRYLLQRYLGRFLLEKLSLEQVTVDLYGGTGTVRDVTLDTQV